MTGDWETLAGLLAERGWNLTHATEQRRAASQRLAQAVQQAAAAGMPETKIAAHADITRLTVRRMLGKTTNHTAGDTP